MPGQEDDGAEVAARRELLLEIEAARSRHANVEDEAARPPRQVGLQQFSR